jgi:flagellar assembly factor FliW
LTPNSWLNTDHLQFLLAFLLRNPENNSGFFHVVPPFIMHKVALFCKVMPRIADGTGNDNDQITYQSNLEGILDYIDTSLDIFEHKFLVLVINLGDMHWASFVVINPFLVFDRYLAEGMKSSENHGTLGADDDIAGWCVLNSNGHNMEKEKGGYKGTFYSNNKPKHGLQMFLNICASYLKAKKENDGDGRHFTEFPYGEPFGEWGEARGTEVFPQFDYQCPSIIVQSNSFDCGLAVVANSIAFIKHLKDVKFRRSDMDICPSKKEFCLLYCSMRKSIL